MYVYREKGKEKTEVGVQATRPRLFTVRTLVGLCVSYTDPGAGTLLEYAAE